MYKNIFFYVMFMVVFGYLFWATLEQGKKLEPSKMLAYLDQDVPQSIEQQSPHIFTNLEKNLHHPLAILVLQILTVLIVARGFGFIMAKMGQPTVIGEILAGIILGPSLLGTFFPEIANFLFPSTSLTRLHVLSQLGLILFMFIVGMEINLNILKEKIRAAIVVSHASIIVPYFLGVVLAYSLYQAYAPVHASFMAFALFMGIAMSITAFPVLARIVQERNLTHTSLGTIVITSAAVSDLTAWCLLAVLIAIVQAGDIVHSVGTIVLSLVYVVCMLSVVKPLLHRFSRKYDTPESVNKMVIAVIFAFLLLSSYLTEIIGLHALFGAFVAGVIMPTQREFRRILTEKVEDVSLVLLLPLFFVFTGLRTQIGLLNHAHLWGVCFLIIGVAIIGKFLGSAVAAKFVGQSWKDSLMIGVLMNARGLMELIVLNIGYDLGVISSEIFTMIVLMALVTTFMTGPAINMIDWFFHAKDEEKKKFPKKGFKTLISFGPAKAGSRLLELAHGLNLKDEEDSSLSAVHFSSSSETSLMEAEQYEREAFIPIRAAAKERGVLLQTRFQVTEKVEKEITKMVKEDNYDIVLVGSSRPIFTEDRIAGKLRAVIQRLPCSVGVFVDHEFHEIHHVAMMCGSPEDIFLWKYAKRFLDGHTMNRVTILNQTKVLLAQEMFSREESYDKRIILLKEFSEKEASWDYDLILMSFAYWKKMKGPKEVWLSRLPSVLIVSK